MSTERLIDVVWSAWTKRMPAIAEGWNGVLIERSTVFCNQRGTTAESINLEMRTKLPDENDPLSALFLPHYHGKVRMDHKALTLHWCVMEETLHVPDNEFEILREGTADVKDLSMSEGIALGQRVAAEVLTWLSAVRDYQECYDGVEDAAPNEEGEHAEGLEEAPDRAE